MMVHMYVRTNPLVHAQPLMQDQLSEEMVETVKWQVNRESAEDKVRDFLEWMKAIKGIVNHLVSSAF